MVGEAWGRPASVTFPLDRIISRSGRRAADRPCFAGDGEIAAGSRTELYLFGPASAVDGRFVSYPAVVAAGTAHVALINLIRSGQRIEAVLCVDLSNCVLLSPPLALGETFAADVPMDATQDWPNGRYIVSNGAALGYRQVPTPAVSDPPVLPLPNSLPAAMDGPMPSGAVLAAAPIYMSPTGDVQASFKTPRGHRAVTENRRRSVVWVGGK